MKYAIFSDIHSNLEALEAVLADIHRHKIQHAICLGDIVGYGPNPSECLEAVREMKVPTVRGNHDHHAAQKKLPRWFSSVAYAGLVYSRSLLNQEQKRYLAGLPLKLKMKGFELVHASLSKPSTWPYVLDGVEADRHFGAQKMRVSFCGHTHQPCVWQYHGQMYRRGIGVVNVNEDDKYLVNVGSVGLPRDENHRACYVIYDTEAQQVIFRRLEYNVARTQGKIIVAGLPPELVERLF